MKTLAQFPDSALLLRSVGDGLNAELCWGNEVLASVPLRCACPSRNPMGMASIVFMLMPPSPPTIKNGERKDGLSSGFYWPSGDLITLHNMERIEEQEQAAVLIHECLHATGSCNRLQRFLPETEIPTAEGIKNMLAVHRRETPDPREDTIEDKQEELIARLGTPLVCSPLGIDVPHWSSWFSRATDLAGLSLDALKEAITEAKRAADYLLHRDLSAQSGGGTLFDRPITPAHSNHDAGND